MLPLLLGQRFAGVLPDASTSQSRLDFVGEILRAIGGEGVLDHVLVQGLTVAWNGAGCDRATVDARLVLGPSDGFPAAL